MEAVTLRPFSQGELAGTREDIVAWIFSGEEPTPAPTVADLRSLVLTGGFPPATARPDPRRRHAWFDAHLATSLQRDVHDVAGIAKLSGLPRPARLLAARTGRAANLAEMSRTSGLPTTTLTRHLTGLRRAVGDRFVRGVVPYGGDAVLPLGDRIWALPISSLWTPR